MLILPKLYVLNLINKDDNSSQVPAEYGWIPLFCQNW